MIEFRKFGEYCHLTLDEKNVFQVANYTFAKCVTAPHTLFTDILET